MQRFLNICVAIALTVAVLPARQTFGQAITQAHYLSFRNVEQLQAYLRWRPDAEPLIGAHRGGPMPGYPENSLASFEHVLTYAPCLIECDVRRTRDSVLVMMHDPTLDRTTTGKGNVSDYTLAELRQLFLKDPTGAVTPYRIPTLGEVLEWARGRAILELDVKKPVTPGEILDAIQRHDALAYVVVITYNLESALLYHRLNPDLVISASAQGIEGTRRLVESGIPARNLIAFVGVSEPKPGVYSLLHQFGIRAILGVLGNLDRRAARRGEQVYVNLLEHGADVLATDNVPMVARAIEEFLQRRSHPAEKATRP